MLNFEPYTIYTSMDGSYGRDREFFMSYEEAYAARMKYANWWCPNGDVWIRHYEKNGCYLIEEWHIRPNGQVEAQFKRTH